MNRTQTVFITALIIIVCISLSGLTVLADQKPLMMATTTSTDNTGLLDYLIPKFTEETGITLKWVATGTGKALRLGQNCDVDVLFVHAPGAEKKYIADGYGVNRRKIMYNDFIIIGPASDPAGIHGKSVLAALTAVMDRNTVFVSRGDESGTHKKEIALWKNSNLSVPDKTPWYIQTGQGMLATINIAAERDGYTLADRGTYIKYEYDRAGKPPLKIMIQGDAMLLNQYSVITVNPVRCKNVQIDLAKRFSQWLTGDAAQKLIKDYKLLGKQLFIPNAK